MARARYPKSSGPLPPPLSPAARTVGQLVAETLHLYGNHFFRALPLGLVVALADQASLGLGIRGRIVVLLAAAPVPQRGLRRRRRRLPSRGSRPGEHGLSRSASGRSSSFRLRSCSRGSRSRPSSCSRSSASAVPAIVMEGLAPRRGASTLARGRTGRSRPRARRSRDARGSCSGSRASRWASCCASRPTTRSASRSSSPTRCSARSSSSGLRCCTSTSPHGSGRLAPDRLAARAAEHRRGEVGSATRTDHEEETMALYLMLTTLDREGRPDAELEPGPRCARSTATSRSSARRSCTSGPRSVPTTSSTSSRRPTT